MMKYKYRVMAGVSIFIGLLSAFQNCSGNVRLVQQEMSVATITGNLTASGLICLPADEVLDSLIVRNINVKINNGRLERDSDGDGLSDYEESLLGTDPLRRRTGGRVLDPICRQFDSTGKNCKDMNLNCTGAFVGFGLNDCDIDVLDLDSYYSHPTQGLDTDKDGVSDYFEIISGTYANIADSSGDLDQDTVPNQMEIERGSNPRQADDGLPSSILLQVQKSKLPPSSACAGDIWQVNIQSIPLVDTLAYVTDDDLRFRHLAGENLLFINLKTRPRSGSGINAKMYLLVKKAMPLTEIDNNFNFTFTDFENLGEILP